MIIRKLTAMGARVEQRMNADGSPFLTDNANPYLHCHFDPASPHLRDPAALDRALDAMPGIVETGLFTGMANEIIVARINGSVDFLKR